MSTTYTFARTEEQELLAANVARLLTRAQPTSQAAVWRALVELGVVGAAFDESHGGFAGDARTLAVIMAQLGAALALQPFLDTAVIAGRILQHWTDGAARQAALDAI